MDRIGPSRLRDGIARGPARWRGLAVRLGSGLAEALAPARCPGCGGLTARDPGPLAPFCCGCSAALPRWRSADGCPRCGGAPTYPPEVSAACPGCLSWGSALHRCHALLRYEGAIRRFVPAFKSPAGPFGPPAIVARAIEALAGELGAQARREAPHALDVIASIPLHPRRERQRGFNHVEPIARRVARTLGLPSMPMLLERVRDTPPQASLAGRSRSENLRGAFRVGREFEGVLRGSSLRVGLVDDVLTTGSTLEAAADALLEAGAFEVRGLALAATLPRSMPRRRSRAGPRRDAYAPAAPAGPEGLPPGNDPLEIDR